MKGCNNCLWATRDGGCASYDCEYIDQQEAYDAFKNKPIRCKDCKHWYNAPVSDGFNSCEHDALIRHEDFYCANAERRTDEE